MKRTALARRGPRCSVRRCRPVRRPHVHGWTTHGPDGGLASFIEIDPASPKILYAGTGGGRSLPQHGRRPDLAAPEQRSPGEHGDRDSRARALRSKPAVRSGRHRHLLHERGRRSDVEQAPEPQRKPALLPGRSEPGADALRVDLQRPAEEHRRGPELERPSDPDFEARSRSRPRPRTSCTGRPTARSTGARTSGMSWTRDDQLLLFQHRADRGRPARSEHGLLRGGRRPLQVNRGRCEPARDPRTGGPLRVCETFEIDPRAPATLYAGTEATASFARGTAARRGHAPWAGRIRLSRSPPAHLRRNQRHRGLARRPAHPSTPARLRSEACLQERERRQPLARAERRPRRRPRSGRSQVDPSHAPRVYAATATTGVWQIRETRAALVADAGFAGRTSTDVAVDPARPRVVWAAVEARASIASGDGGRTWKRRLKPQGSKFQRRRGRASNPRFVYAGTFERGLYRSSNGGRNWTRARPSPTRHGELDPVHPRRPQEVWVAHARAVLRSHDGGVTFSKPSEGLPMSAEADALALDPRSSRRVLMRPGSPVSTGAETAARTGRG